MIKIQNSEKLLPDFLMDSEHFFYALLDVEGQLIDANSLLLDHTKLKLNEEIFGFLETDSAEELSELLDQMISKPHDSRNILLNFSKSDAQKSNSIWWEFSMVLNDEMDIIGLVGLGVSLKFLEHELPWEHLVEVLHFGKIELTNELLVSEVEEKVALWLGKSSSELKNKALADPQVLVLTQEQLAKIKALDNQSQPLFLKIPGQFPNQLALAGLLTKHASGYTFLLAPSKKTLRPLADFQPFTSSQLAAIQGAVWIVDQHFTLIQQNSYASAFSKENGFLGLNLGLQFSTTWAGSRKDQLSKAVIQSFEGKECALDLRVGKGDDGIFLNVRTSPIFDDYGRSAAVMIQALDVTKFYGKIRQLESENKELKDLALKPSHILRSPLSSMLGLLDLIDQQSMDEENRKYFSYLKPLAHELDEVIRSNAKKMSALD